MPTTSSRMVPSLPAGFRFHPTDEELIVHYLMNQAASVPCPVPIIAEVNIYHCNPWDLPTKALFGEKEWYFFSPRDRKYPNGARPNRAAGSGYWKATGTDKAILSSSSSPAPSESIIIGVKKALVFYRGKPPKGVKTDWVMHEYRLTIGTRNSKNTTKRRGSSSSSSSTSTSMRLDDWVLCRIYKKTNNNNSQLLFSEDQEQDGSSDTSLNNDHHHQFPPPPSNIMSMTKSCSLTDLLNTIDYSTLSQLLLDAPAETETTPAACPPPLTHNNNVNNNNNNSLKRTRIMTGDGGASSSTSSFDDHGRSLKRKLQMLPTSDSRSSSTFFLGSSSSYRSNQQLAEAGGSISSSFQYSGLLPSHNPFLNQQLLLMNSHLQMQ